MTPERWQRLKPLYNAALDLPSQNRRGFVEQLSADDHDLGADLKALLSSHDVTSDILDTPIGHLSSLLTAAPSTLLPGTLLVGRFRIVRHLGSGGMGDVYEALDEQMEQGRIALKTVRPAIAANPVALARFKDEVRLARRVSGPNVCRIHELYLINSEDPGQRTAFLTMELLEGITLHERIESGGALALPDMRRIAGQLCTALCCIHESGIVHGDLKPRNVMLVRSGETERVVVTDFGLARAAAGSTTLGGDDPLIAGTPSYMAPEQFEGRDLTPSTDVYALGVMLYEMATGVQPYAAHTPLAAAIRRSKVPVHASTVRTDLPAGWDDVIARCLRYDTEQRFQSAEAVEQQLAHPGKISLRLGRKHRITLPLPLLWITAAGAAAVMCLAVWLAFLRPRHRELAPDAAHWYALGMTALREGSYLKATRLLTLVTERDPTYALAHAALADAWTELDYTGVAQHEMLLAAAPAEQRGLDDTERRYIDAVRSTLIRDYSAAAQDYEAILQRLPAGSKAEGYVDLGRIYEKAGKVPETLAAYERAAKLNPDDPAPFLHLGILRSRQRDATGADAAFREAERLYNAETNLEGLAEVSYQRGYAANDTGNSARAEELINKSLAIARQIPNVQMETRSLSQLSSIAYDQDKVDQAVSYATQAIALARANGLDYWVTDGLIRLGNAFLYKEDYVAAETPLEQALTRARDGGHPRLEALAKYTLSSLRFQQQRWGDSIQLATSALRYFQDYGFEDLADEALTQIARSQRNQGKYQAALDTGNTLLRNAQRTQRTAYQMLAEQMVSSVLARLQRYPEALTHLDHGLVLQGTSESDRVFLSLLRADMLWKLGRYAEASAELARTSAQNKARQDVGSYTDAIAASMELSQGHARAALMTAQDAWAHFPALQSSTAQSNRLLLRTAALSALSLSDSVSAKVYAGKLAALDPAKAEIADLAQTRLMQASLELASGDATNAGNTALDAQRFFSEKEMLESAALSLLLAAKAASHAGDAAGANSLSRRSVDIFRRIAQSWGDPTFQQFLTRPDLQQSWRELVRLRAASGETLNATLP